MRVLVRAQRQTRCKRQWGEQGGKVMNGRFRVKLCSFYTARSPSRTPIDSFRRDLDETRLRFRKSCFQANLLKYSSGGRRTRAPDRSLIPPRRSQNNEKNFPYRGAGDRAPPRPEIKA